MSQSIFQQTRLIPCSFLQGLFSQFPDKNAVIELNNLLATKPVREITSENISEIERRYGISLLREFKLNLEEFYAVYLNRCLIDGSLSVEEVEDLRHLRSILFLDESTVSSLHNRIGEIVYKKSFEEAVSDGSLSKEEEMFLDKLEADLKLPKYLVEKISNEARAAHLQNYVTKVTKDNRLSPEDEKEIAALAANLNITIELDNKSQDQLQKLKRYWALENLPLPTVQPDIIIQKSEQCYFQMSNVKWYELRKIRQRTSRSGYSTSLKVAKGFYLRSGSYTSKSYSSDEMTLIDTGTVYLTNKRVIFTGSQKNSNIRFEKILNLTPYSDGLEIDKETGKSPTLQLPTNADIFCIMLERLIIER